jgi:hypothetical protein
MEVPSHDAGQIFGLLMQFELGLIEIIYSCNLNLGFMEKMDS